MVFFFYKVILETIDNSDEIDYAMPGFFNSLYIADDRNCISITAEAKLAIGRSLTVKNWI